MTEKINRQQLIEAVRDIIDRYDTKLTLRQIFYQLVSKHIIPNNISAYQRLSKTLVWARHNGEIDWESIEDRTRILHGRDEEPETPEDHFRGAMRYFANCDDYYRLPFWHNQEKYLEVWFEKQALQSLFYRITDQYNVSGLPIRGYSSHTVGHELRKRVEEIIEQRPMIKEYIILYFGDFDPSGEDIFRFIQDMSEMFNLSINFEKIAITPEQIKKYNIPPMMAKKSDSRYNGFVAKYGEKSAVELDALDPEVLQKMIKESIERHIDEDIREERSEEQEELRAKVRAMIKKTLGAKLYKELKERD